MATELTEELNNDPKPSAQLFHDIVFGRGVHPKPDLFGEKRRVNVDDVEHLLDVFIERHGSRDQDNIIRVKWAEIDLVFEGQLFARPDLVLRSQIFTPKWAQYLRLLGLGGVATYGWIDAMINANHEGYIHDTTGNNCLDPDALQPIHLWSKDLLARSDYLNKWRESSFPMLEWHEISFDMRELFGVCVKGTLDKFKKFAATPPSRQRDEHLVAQTIFIDAACRIHAGAILQEAARLFNED